MFSLIQRVLCIYQRYSYHKRERDIFVWVKQFNRMASAVVLKASASSSCGVYNYLVAMPPYQHERFLLFAKAKASLLFEQQALTWLFLGSFQRWKCLNQCSVFKFRATQQRCSLWFYDYFSSEKKGRKVAFSMLIIFHVLYSHAFI